MVHMLAEYEAVRAHHVTVKFKRKAHASYFANLAGADSIEVLRALGYGDQARRVIINQITMAMVSDCLHHIYEALRCLEKRKMIVALNLLRKPLTDNLIYLAWMAGDEDDFYRTFTAADGGLTTARLGNRRVELLQKALDRTELASVLDAEFLHRTLFDRRAPEGLYRLFQHAVHLITAKHVEIQTVPENFNFIFKSYADDDIYKAIHYGLPHALLYLGHIVLALFERMEPMDPGAKTAFETRSLLGLYLVEGGENTEHALVRLHALTKIKCPGCGAPFSVTPHNAARIVMSESYRCPKCQRVTGFPFSWLF